jgi:hypothetical protein
MMESDDLLYSGLKPIVLSCRLRYYYWNLLGKRVMAFEMQRASPSPICSQSENESGKRCVSDPYRGRKRKEYEGVKRELF